jgi:hypothetical protein
LLFYLCEGRRAGPGYAHPQVSYLHSPRLRLLVSDVRFHRKRAVPWRDDPPGCLACMRRDLAPGALLEMWVSGRSGRFGLNARRRSTLETFSSGASEPT